MEGQKLTRIIEAIAVLATLAALLIGSFNWLNENHAERKALLETELELRAEIIDRDVKKQAEARVYYKDIAKSRVLEPAEESRLEYLEEQMEYKYDEQRLIQSKLMDIKE
jgi:hypothetical protein